MLLDKIKFFIKFIYKFNIFYKIKLISLFIISFLIFYFFILSISIELDTSYFWKKNLYLSFSTPYIVTPSNVKEEDFDELNISLKKQLFKNEDTKNILTFESLLKKENFIFFHGIFSSGTFFYDDLKRYIPVFIYAIDFNNIKYFDGLSFNNEIDKELNENDGIVTEQLKDTINKYDFLGTITKDGDYNMAKIYIKSYIKYENSYIKDLYYPCIYISKNLAKKLFGVNNIEQSSIFIYKKDAYPHWEDKINILNLMQNANLDGKLFTADMSSKEIKMTFKYIDLSLSFLIFLVSIIVAIFYILVNYLTIKDRYVIIGIFKSFGFKDIKLFFLFFYEILIFNLFSFILSIFFYIFTIKYIFHYNFSVGSLFSTRLNIHLSLFFFILPILLIQTFISCYAIYLKIKKLDIINILGGEN